MLDNPKIIICGCGASASIAKHYFPESMVIGKVTSPTYNFGLHYLHRPLEDIFEMQKIKVETTIDFEPVTKEGIERYKKSVYGDTWEEHTNKEGQFPVGVTYGWLIKGDKKPLKVDRDGMIQHIDIYKKTIEVGSSTYFYDVLINTIPLNIFAELIGIKMVNDFQHSPICIHQRVCLRTDKCDPYLWTNYDTKYEYYRYTKLFNDNKIFETKEHIGDCLDGVVTLRPGKILNSGDYNNLLQNLFRKEVYSVGRYAQWDSSVLLHNVDDRVRTIKDMLNEF